MLNADNDLMKERIRKLQAIRDLGIDPYGGRFETSGLVKDLLASFEEGKKVRIAGRFMAIRLHGKSAFCDLRDSTGKIQIYVKEGVLDASDYKVFELLDIGDFVGVEGELFKTRTGESSVKALRLCILSKSVRPLPEKWHGLTDTETRFRHRYLDLASNPEVQSVFRARSRVVSEIRKFLDARDYLEVETPMMHPIPGGAAGKPFKTHHEALDTDLYLRVAPELYLKKLLVGGFERVYEINKSFRNEGISTRHNPEFTMLEVYTAYDDVENVMKLTEDLVKSAAQAVFGSLKIPQGEGKPDLDLSQWQRVSFAEIMKKNFGIEPDDDESKWADKLKKNGVKIEGKDLSRTQLINLVGDLIDPGKGASAGHPVFVTEYFTELCPLAKKNKKNSAISDRFELYVGGMEIANGYSELNDPLEQRERLMAEIREKGKEATSQNLDEDFLLALEHGMPPAGGLGIGIDRLIMVLTGRDTIREVVLFPQLKPEKP